MEYRIFCRLSGMANKFIGSQFWYGWKIIALMEDCKFIPDGSCLHCSAPSVALGQTGSWSAGSQSPGH